MEPFLGNLCTKLMQNEYQVAHHSRAKGGVTTSSRSKGAGALRRTRGEVGWDGMDTFDILVEPLFIAG